MDFAIPTDLITKAQIGFREAAGLSSFDRNAASPPSVSTVESSISSLSPSPSYLRCKFCQGKLLRGVQSLICVYCGEYQKQDLHPEPISFNSTHGYSWLLQSLHFNGSERVGSLAEGSGVDGGHSPAEDELTLSDLLDLKISLREPQKPETNIKTSDFDNFFTSSVSKTAVVSDVLEEQPVASKSDQDKIIQGQENVTSDWSAEFQSADTKMESEKVESVDPFAGAEADLSAHVDTGFGQTESFDFKKPNNDSDPFQDDLFANMGSTTFQQNDKLDSVLQDVNDSSLKDGDGDWFSDGNWQKSSVTNTLDDVTLHDNPNELSTDWFENASWQKPSTNKTETVQDDSFSLFDNKPHSNDMIMSEKQDLDNSDKNQSDVTDWFQNIPVSKTDDDNDGFGEWNAFTSVNVNQGSVQDSWKESGDEKVDYGTSENMLELNMYQPTVDTKEVDFGDFLQSDIFSGDKNPTDTNTQEVYDIFSEVPTGNRNANIEAGNKAEGSKNDDFFSNATTNPKDDVQMLMSQMHDLSFMLKNELSVPSKPDDIGTSHS